MAAPSGSVSQSDAFGQNQAIRVEVATRPSSASRIGAVLACLIPVPGAPAVGAFLGAHALSAARRDMSIAPGASAAFATRAGLVCTLLQVLAIGLAAFTFWHTAEGVKSAAKAGVAASEAGRLTDVTKLTADVDFTGIAPGRTVPVVVIGPDLETTIDVRVGTSLTWNGMGFTFESSAAPSSQAISSMPY
ncbi:MAG: hypothetical protein AAGB48_09920 [Planctomycetota bacterium]